MSITGIVMQLVLLVLASFGISTLMEWYKKKVRKGEAGVWEIRGVSAVLSILAALGFKFTGAFTPVLSAIWPSLSVWFDVALYAIIIWVCQLEGDMKLVKQLVKLATNNFLTEEKAETELKRLLESFKNTTTVDFNVVAVALHYIGVTEEKLRKALDEIGVDEAKANELIIAFKAAAGIVGEDKVVEG